MKDVLFSPGRFSLSALCLLCLALPGWAAFSPERACFQARCNEQPLAYQTQCLFVLPGEAVCLEVKEKCRPEEYSLEAPCCGFKPVSSAVWRGVAPASPGLYPALLKRASDQQTLRVQIFVMVPFTQLRNGKINGYLIGTYPVPRGRVAGYGLPKGFIKVTPANRNAAVSPHFQLNQFLCKQAGTGEQYIVLRPELVDKLEKILEQVNIQGHARQTLRLLSAYRTPYYNRLIHDVRYSAHQWGLAADVYLEGDTPGREDDLNGDGRVDVRDAEIFFRLVDAWDAAPGNACLLGGIGLYPRTSEHGPFVHIDARGYYARWAEAPACLPGAEAKRPQPSVPRAGSAPRPQSARGASPNI